MGGHRACKKRGVLACLSSQRGWVYESNTWWCAVVSKQGFSLMDLQSYFGMWYVLKQSKVSWTHQNYDTSRIICWKIHQQHQERSAWKKTTVRGVFSIFSAVMTMKVAPSFAGPCARDVATGLQWVLSLSTKAKKIKPKCQIFNTLPKQQICSRISPCFPNGTSGRTVGHYRASRRATGSCGNGKRFQFAIEHGHGNSWLTH